MSRRRSGGSTKAAAATATRLPAVERTELSMADRDVVRAETDRLRATAQLSRAASEQLAALAESTSRRGKLFAAKNYKSAGTNDVRGDWATASMAPDDTLRDELQTLVARQREQVRNNPWARALVEQMRSYVVGSQPWSTQPAARVEVLERFGLTAAQVDAWNKRCDEVFEEAAASDALDRERCCDLWEMTRRAYGMRLDFDGFARIYADKDSAAGVSVKLIEGDLIRTPDDRRTDPLVSLGVRLDKKTGEPWGYYLHNRYVVSPQALGERTNELVKRLTPAGQPQMLHLFRPDRVGQRRGIPWLATVLGELDDLSSFAEAELMAARVSACIALIIQSQSPLELDPRTGKEKLNLKPGANLRVGPNDTVTPFNPSRPNNSFEPFVKWRQRDVSASLGFSATLATRDFENANYSVSRTILFDAKRTFEAEQRWLGAVWFRPIYRRVIEAAWMDGRLPLMPLFDSSGGETQVTAELFRAAFTAPPYGFIDPMTEVEAMGKAIEYRLIDYKDAIGQLGKDDRLVHRNLAEQVDRLRAAGIAPVGGEAVARFPASESAQPAQPVPVEDQTPAEATL